MKRVRDLDKLREAVKERDVTHRELAAAVGCSVGLVGHVLAGRRSLRPDMARRMARVLRQPVALLFVDAVASDEQDDDHEAAAS